jgi:hypothetical protein
VLQQARNRRMAKKLRGDRILICGKSTCVGGWEGWRRGEAK